MEKGTVNTKPPSSSKAKMILKFLPKPAAISFQSLPFSPGGGGRDKSSRPSVDLMKTHYYMTNYNNNNNKGFPAGPMVSIVPARKSKLGQPQQQAEEEPTSPKVSCIGQIKHKQKQKHKKKKMAKHEDDEQKKKRSSSRIIVDLQNNNDSSNSKQQQKKKKEYARSLTTHNFKFQERMNNIGKIFHGARRSVDAATTASADKHSGDAASLGQMKRFASGRETMLSDFDWKAAASVHHIRKCYDHYSDTEEEDDDDEYEDDDHEDDDDREITIPFSAPILPNNNIVNGHGSTTLLALEPRKEINLWKRRTMAQPKPLQLQLRHR